MSLGAPHNLLLITASHLRTGYLSCYGNPFIRTERIDALARSGAAHQLHVHAVDVRRLHRRGSAAAAFTKDVLADMVQRAPELPSNLGPAAMIRWSHWKLSMYTDDMNELYNLAEDPLEMFNRYNDPACQEIRQILTERRTRRLPGVKDRLITWNGKGRDPRFNPL
jgi:arylsulfatase A-like enzyme